MAKRRSRDRAIIAQLPYGSRAAGLTSSLNDSQTFESYAQRAFADGSQDGASGPNVYVYPDMRGVSEDGVRKSAEALTESPVVYIVTIKQDKRTLERKWLANVIGDRRRDAFHMYRRPYVVYVGETNNILSRTNQHLTGKGHFGNVGGEETYEDIAAEVDERTLADRVIQDAVANDYSVKEYIVWDTFFTKSMTLDLENKFIDYFHALDEVYVLNGRGNPQRNYYKVEEKDAVCSRVWQYLSFDDPVLFPPEHDIWNSELYKVSPFHALGKEQSRAVNDICDNALKLISGGPVCGEPLEPASSDARLVIVEGASGTGKSIVLSTLFVRLSEALRLQNQQSDDSDFGIRPNSKVCLIVNQDQQLTMYTNLAKKIGLMRTNADADRCVYKATPYLNAVRSGKREAPEIVLVDEAHLLRTSPHRSYSGRFFHGNQLYDILLSGAKVVIAVFDPEQVMRSSQHWDPGLVKRMLPSNRPCEGGKLSYSGVLKLTNNGNSLKAEDTFHAYHIALSEQFRIDADDGVIRWIDRLADLDQVGMEPMPADRTFRNPPSGVHGMKPYDLRVYSSPVELARAIDRRRAECAPNRHLGDSSAQSDGSKRFSAPLCRMLATYDWGYDTASGQGRVTLYRVERSGCARWVMPENGSAPDDYHETDGSRFSYAWNYSRSGEDKDQTWSGDPVADDEVGSYFSIQGFDLNYAGVIIGPSIRYVDGRIVIDASASCDGEANGEYAQELILQQFKVLIRRGMHGLYLFAVDPGLQSALERSARASGRLDLDD